MATQRRTRKVGSTLLFVGVPASASDTALLYPQYLESRQFGSWKLDRKPPRYPLRPANIRYHGEPHAVSYQLFFTEGATPRYPLLGR